MKRVSDGSDLLSNSETLSPKPELAKEVHEKIIARHPLLLPQRSHLHSFREASQVLHQRGLRTL